jgi:NAD-dependent deacetylase
MRVGQPEHSGDRADDPGESTAMTEQMDRARRLVADAHRIVVLTGAGISAESGVPTFRGAGGMWKSQRPEELATPEAFARDPQTVWDWYSWRRGLVADCAPNQGHLALARLALGDTPTAIVTQNVDGLHTRAAHQAAGIADPSPALPVEVHGAIDRDKCSECGARTPGTYPVDTSSRGSLPRCAACNGMLRPDVVWFGEVLEPAVLSHAFQVAQDADLCLVVGTSALVQPAASVPLVTLRGGGTLIEVNLEPTPLSREAELSLLGPASELLPELFDV